MSIWEGTPVVKALMMGGIFLGWAASTFRAACESQNLTEFQVNRYHYITYKNNTGRKINDRYQLPIACELARIPAKSISPLFRDGIMPSSTITYLFLIPLQLRWRKDGLAICVWGVLLAFRLGPTPQLGNHSILDFDWSIHHLDDNHRRKAIGQTVVTWWYEEWSGASGGVPFLDPTTTTPVSLGDPGLDESRILCHEDDKSD
jgi:hypothetical protein